MDVYQHSFKTVNGENLSLNEFRDNIILIVNTASHCGYTHQYAILQEIFVKYKDQGVRVLAFPSNDFGSQEPGTNEEIAEFCKSTFDISFPVIEKTSVLTNNLLYKDLKEITNQIPAWNFHKYLIGKNSTEIKSFTHTDQLMSVVDNIEKMLDIGDE